MRRFEGLFSETMGFPFESFAPPSGDNSGKGSREKRRSWVIPSRAEESGEKRCRRGGFVGSGLRCVPVGSDGFMGIGTMREIKISFYTKRHDEGH